jgi:hypothetical protein
MAKTNRKLKVDMTGVESYTRCPEGEQLARVKKIDMGTVQGSGDDALKVIFEVIKGDGKGCQVFETFSLGEKALWKLKQFLTAIGVKADGKLSLDLDKLEGKICTIDVIHEEYNGQKRAKISEYLNPSDDSDEEDEEEEEDEDDEDDEDEKPVKKSKKSPSKKSKKPVEDEDEDEDEEDDEPPVKSKKSSKKAAPKKSAKKRPEPEDDDEDDDDDWDEDEDD